MTAILRRKLSEAQNDTSKAEMSGLRALRLSTARAGDALFDLALGVVGARQKWVRPDDMAAVLSDQDLLVVLDCASGYTGAASLSLPLVTALIQQQTMSVVSDRVPEARAYTDTDAAMCAPLVEGLLARAADLAQVEADQASFAGLRFGARAEDVRTLTLALRAEKYRIIWLTVDIALGLHQAEVILALPDAPTQPEGHGDGASGGEARVTDSPLLDVPAEVEAVLARFRLPLSELNALKVGDCLPLRRDRLDDTAILSPAGDVIARGRLGQMNGARAVRLMAPQEIPSVADQPRHTSFNPLASEEAATQAAPAMPEVEMSATAFDADVPEESLATLTPDEAAAQISELAGLSDADLTMPDIEGAEFTPADLPQIDPGDAEFPDIPPIDDLATPGSEGSS